MDTVSLVDQDILQLLDALAGKLRQGQRDIEQLSKQLSGIIPLIPTDGLIHQQIPQEGLLKFCVILAVLSIDNPKSIDDCSTAFLLAFDPTQRNALRKMVKGYVESR